MLTAQARREVEHATATHKLSLIASVHADAKLESAAKIRDLVERGREIDAVYRLAKQPFLEALSAYAGLHIVDTLEGTPSVIVSGPAGTWRRFLEERATVISDPSIEIQTNAVEWVVD